MTSVKLVAVTQPKVEGIANAQEFVAYAARVSNPGNQLNTETSVKLLKYLLKNRHWSPFEMVHATLEINTTREIAHQIVRHRSFAFQEFSQRYADVREMGFTLAEARLQDQKNRQNSIDLDDLVIQENWKQIQQDVLRVSTEAYDWALRNGLAKEVARKALPEGLTNSRLYMSGSLRSWIHYLQARLYIGTQKEHREVAEGAKLALQTEFPDILDLISDEM